MVASKAGLFLSLMLVLAAMGVWASAQTDPPVVCPVGGYPLISCPVANDAVIAQTIRSRFAGLFACPAQQVNVSANGGRVILSGWVQSQAQKDTAGILASSVRGVLYLDNQLCIAPPRDSDLVIARNVMNAIGRSLYGVLQVRAVVKNGIVTLTGVVEDEYTRSMVGLIPEGIPGVTAVHNGIVVSQNSWTY